MADLKKAWPASGQSPAGEFRWIKHFPNGTSTDKGTRGNEKKRKKKKKKKDENMDARVNWQ